MNRQDKIKLSLNISIITALLVVVISAALLINYWQLSKNDPLESEALKTLVERSFDNPDDEALRSDVRQLDLLARKAFFTAKWQTQLGSWLLLVSGILLVVSLRVYFHETQSIDKPEKNTRKDAVIAAMSQKWIMAVGGLIVVLAFVSGFITHNHIDDFASQKETVLAEVEPEEDEIEVVEVPSVAVDTLQQEDATASIQDSAVVEEVVEEVEIAPYPTLTEMKANFPSFRGFFGNGVVNFKNIPTSWSKTKNVLWKTEIPVHGYNSPVIWEDKLFVAGGNDSKRVVYCLDHNSGKILWEVEVKGVPGSPSKAPKTTDDTGLSAASVTTDGRKVFAIFGNGDIIALDIDGEEMWKKNFGVPDNHYGHSSSLMLYRDKLYIQYDSNKGGKLYALDTETGKTKWEKVRNCKISWASPIIADIDGKKQLILSSNPIVAGYDLDSGEELWSVDCMYGEVGPSPAYGSGLIFAANEYAKLVAIDPADGYKVKWEDDEYLPEVSSPVVSNDLLFIATSYGTLVCYDAVKGVKYWEQEYNDGFYSSPMVVDGKLYALDMGGVMHIIKVDKKFQLIAEPTLAEEMVTTPAFSNGRIYLRGKKYLYCIGK